MRAMFEKNGSLHRAVRRAAVPVLIAYIAILAWSASRIPGLKLDFGFHTFFEKSRDLPALGRYKEMYGEDINLVIVVVESDYIFTAGSLRALDKLTRFLEKQPEVAKVVSLTRVDFTRSREDEISVEPFIDKIPEERERLEALRREALGSRELDRFLVSGDGRVTAVVGEIEGGMKRQNRLLAAIEDWIEKEKRGNPAGKIEYRLGGVNVVQREYERVATGGIISNGILILAVMGLLLLVQYGRAIGVILPLACALACMLIVLGLMQATGEPVNIVNQVVPELMLILGVADGIYILSRYFEERQRHAQPEALGVTIRHMTVACFFTSLTTAVGFGSLYAAQMHLIKRFGLYCAAGVMISYFNVILLNSSVLSLAGRGSGPAVGMEEGKGSGPDLTGRFLRWITNVVTRHQGKVVLVSILLVAASAAFICRIRMHHKLLSELDEDNKVVRTNEKFEKNLFGILSFAIEFEGPPGSMVEPATLEKIDRIAGEIEKEGEVRKLLSLPDTLKEFNMKWMGEGEKYRTLPRSRALAVQYLDFLDPDLKRRIVSEDYSRTRIMIRTKNVPSTWWYDMMERLAPRLERSFPPGGKIKWGWNGSSHLAAKTLHHLMKDLLSTMALSLLTITLLMALLFRSLVIGLYSMVPNVVPLVITFGFMGASGIELRPATAIIFAISLGIVVNDTIHLMARFREEMSRRAEVREAVTATIMTAGRPVVYTSVLLVCGYSVLLGAEFIAVRHFSLLMAVTLSSALLADLFLTPVLLLHLPGTRRNRH